MATPSRRESDVQVYGTLWNVDVGPTLRIYGRIYPALERATVSLASRISGRR